MSRRRESIVPLVIAAILVAAIPLYAVVIDPMIRKGNGLVAASTRVVTVDINPSIELSVDASNLVLEAKALNQDAETLLATLTLKGLPAPEAVQRIVAAAVTLGFIDPAAADTYVEIAVEDNGDGSQADEKRLETDLMDSAAQGLRDKGAQGSVEVSKVVHARITEAAALDISAGRLNLIDRLAAALGQTREEVLAQYKDASVKQIMKALNAALGHGSGPTGKPGDPTAAPTDPAAKATQAPDGTSTPAPTAAATATQAPAATATPTPRPTATPTPKPKPTATPTVAPTVTPDVVGGATK